MTILPSKWFKKYILYCKAFISDSFIFMFSKSALFIFRNSLQRCSIEIGALKNFIKVTGKHLRQSLWWSCRPAALIKKRFWRSCFLVNFVKFLRTRFSQNISRRLFLYFEKCFLLLCHIFLNRRRQWVKSSKDLEKINKSHKKNSGRLPEYFLLVTLRRKHQEVLYRKRCS